MSAEAPPHLLVIITDQHAAHALSVAGADHLNTPNLDALTARGTRFTRAYTTFPLCVPARSSLLTGRYPHQLGIGGNQLEDVGQPGRAPESLGHLLHAAGYRCGYAGKWHATAADVSDADGFEPVAPFGDAGLVQRAARWLRDRAAERDPFALVVSFDDPHTICEYARNQPMPYGDVDPVPLRECPPLPANFGPQPFEPEVVRFEQQAAAAMYGTVDFSAEDWRAYRHAYARLVERVDARIGELLDVLDRSGRAPDTVVIFTSDHGDGDAAHAWNQKTALWQETVKVPLVIADPRVLDPVAECPALVSVGLDLLPTLLGLAGGSAPPELTGLNLSPAVREPGRTGHDHVVIQTRFERVQGPLTSGRALIGPRYKYVVYSWGRWREQLFDLDTDQGEQRNLAVEAAFDPILEIMRGRLLAWCRETGDQAFLKRLVLPADVDPAVRAEIFAVPY